MPSFLHPVPRVLCLLTALVMAGCRTPEGPPPDPTPVPLPTPRPVSGFRRPPRGTLITGFERLAGWTVTSSSGETFLQKNGERAVWGSFAAEIHFKPEGKGPHRVVLTPDEPLVIRSPFNTLVMWALHEGKAGLRADHAVRLEGRDAQEEQRSWRFPYRPAGGWQLLHQRETGEVPWPVEIRELVWEIPAGVESTQILILDSLSIYQEVLGRIPREIEYVRPHGYAPSFAPSRENSVRLDFPRNDHAFRPSTLTERFVTSAVRVEEGVFDFVFERGGLRTTYRVRAETGGPAFRAWTGENEKRLEWSGPRVDTVGVVPELRYARLREGRLWLQYTEGLSFECFLRGATLQVEAQSLSESVTGFHLGRIGHAGGEVPRRIYPPFFRLNESTRWPVFFWEAADSPRLASLIPDWWYSMAASYEPAEETGKQVSLGTLRYPERWRGSRNVFRERLYFTVEERLEGVLPQPAHPGGLYADKLDDGWVADSVAPGEASLVWESADKNVRHPLDSVTRLMSVEPTDEKWDPDLLARERDGDWLRHPGGGWVVKSARLYAFEVDRYLPGGPLPERILEEGITTRPPWRFTDFDARLPGAGTYAQTWVEIGGFLQQVEAETSAPVIGRGGATWFWSGLVSGLLPEFPLGLEELHPFLPHVSWGFIHPGTVPLGLGRLEGFRLPGESEPPEAMLADRLLAAQVAYGATGRMPALEDPVARRKFKWFLAALHPRLSRATADRIAYWDGDRFLDVAEALRTGTYRDSRLYLRLGDATEIWVNGHMTDIWEVRVDGEIHRLPSFGFVVRGKDIFALSGVTEAGGARCILEHPDSVWIHVPGNRVSRSGLTAEGSVRIRKGLADGAVEVDLMEGAGVVRIEPELLGLETVGTVEAEDAEGNKLSGATLQRVGEAWVLQSDTVPAHVRIYPTVRGSEKYFVP